MRIVNTIKLGFACCVMFAIALIASIWIVDLQEGSKTASGPAWRRVPPPPPAVPAFRSALAKALMRSAAPAQQVNIEIDPKTPVAELLPPALASVAASNTLLVQDLGYLPEVTFQAPVSSKLDSQDATLAIAQQLAKIRHVNQTKIDGFLSALIDHRPDLQGLPFAMGEACRTVGEKVRYLAAYSAETRTCIRISLLRNTVPGPKPPAVKNGMYRNMEGLSPIDAKGFWVQMESRLPQTAANLAPGAPTPYFHDCEPARVAAVTQIVAPESAAVRLGLVKYLSKTPHVDATKALAKLALFTVEDEVRLAAIHELKLRREKDYASILMQGLRYPLPKVAKRAADALIRLECTTVVPQLVDLLDEADPRLPVTREVDGKKVVVVREVVRVNHHRNCILCHAPADFGGATGGKFTKSQSTALTKPASLPLTLTDLTAQVPLPNAPLPSISDGGYGNRCIPAILVRFDVTYLRPDFSLLLPVPDAAPWPDMQRFDFIVRTRVLSTKEAEEDRQLGAKAGTGVTAPYQRAVLLALQELTQRDAGPSSEAWRELLGLPAKSGP